MEKKQSIYFTPAKPGFHGSLYFLFLHNQCPKNESSENRYGAFDESMALYIKIKQAELDLYKFKPGQTIASIVASWGGVKRFSTPHNNIPLFSHPTAASGENE